MSMKRRALLVLKGSRGSEVIPEPAPNPDSLIVDKTRFSGFFGNRLAELPADIEPDEVWVTGVVSSICVMDTTGGLRDRDYAAVIPVDAVADIDPAWHEFALERMKRIYGARLIQTRTRGAGTPYGGLKEER
jgi:nicotinamidase-related amidase